MQVFLVGGAVRDSLLGLPVKDCDYVVVGATPKDMLALGFRQVGRHFPVFLHPETGEEYALARRERKTGHGYTGFSVDFAPNVTLEEDLRRRDLTINAMAQCADGMIIDPFAGQKDLNRKILRHVSSAFIEDPLRVLRLMRFWARFSRLGFTIAEDTLALCREMSISGELSTLTTERVWRECEKALSYDTPQVFFQGLQSIGALFTIIGNTTVDISTMNANLALAVTRTTSPEIRFAFWLEGQTAAIDQVKTHLPLPVRYQRWIDWVTKYAKVIRNWQSADKLEKYHLVKALNGLKEDTLIIQLVQAIGVDIQPILTAIHTAKTITPQALMAEGFQGAQLGIKLMERQMMALEAIAE